MTKRSGAARRGGPARAASPAARVRETAPTAGARICYVESSALVASLLESDAAAIRAFTESGRLVASAMTFAESGRAIVRAMAAGRVAPGQAADLFRALAAFAAQCANMDVTTDVLARAARPFPVEPVRTLDAIHLATLDALRVPPHLVDVVTRDARVAANARALGYVVRDAA